MIIIYLCFRRLFSYVNKNISFWLIFLKVLFAIKIMCSAPLINPEFYLYKYDFL